MLICAPSDVRLDRELVGAAALPNDRFQQHTALDRELEAGLPPSGNPSTQSKQQQQQQQ